MTALPLSDLRPDEPFVGLHPCTGQTDLFFAPPGERPDARAAREAQAKAVCATCDIRDACRAVARERGEYGVWGGETEDERAAAGYPQRRNRL